MFRARTEPEQLRRWWGPGEFTCSEAEVDLQPGGQGSYDLEPAGPGTRRSFRLRAAPRGLARLMGPMVARTMAAEVAQLDRLREVLEA